MQYREAVKAKLRNVATIYYPSENGKFAAYTFRMLYEWTRDYHWPKNMDTIYWNSGLWDVVRIYDDLPQSSLNTYEEMLERTFQRLRYLFPKAKIIFALTTPVQEAWYGKNFFRKNEDIQQYNEIARKVCANYGECVDDLWSLIFSRGEVLYKDATHFRSEGIELLAEHISSTIRNNLREKIKVAVEEVKRSREQRKRNFYEVIERRSPFLVYGAGEMFCKYISRFKMHGNVQAVCDRAPAIHGQKVRGIQCIPPSEIRAYGDYAVITASRTDSVEEIQMELEKAKIEFIQLSDALEVLEENQVELEERFLEREYPHGMKNANPDEDAKLKKYINLHVPANSCNLQCRYCYVGQTGQMNKGLPKINHSPRYIRFLLRREKVGGAALVGICGAGETLLCDKIVDICRELLYEGHYLHIVTNGLLTERIKSILHSSGEYAKHIFFKISFHYEQLKQKNLLDSFVSNVSLIANSLASYSLEMMPHDELISHIEDIKEFSLKHFGAFPHLTVGRDENDGRKLLSQLTVEEYVDIWKCFNSSLFDFKMKWYMSKGENCHGGELGLQIDLLSGAITHCCATSEILGNLYDTETLSFPPIGRCPVDFCYNSHAYATLGVMPDKRAPFYLELRDRISQSTGAHWMKKPFQRFLMQRLYENNDIDID